MNRNTRKNPFGQATAYNGPPANANQDVNMEISEDPMFKDFSQPQNQFQAPNKGFANRQKNPFNAQNDANYAQNIPQDPVNSFNDFSNSGWSTGPSSGTFYPPDSMEQNQQFSSQPNQFIPSGSGADGQMSDDLNEPPLLEDLGIDLKQIFRKMLSIISLRKIDKEIVDDADLSGPLIIAILFGTILLFRGKVQFGYIYGFGLTGCLGIFCLLKSMITKEQPLYLYTIMSVLGYCLLPFTILATVTLFLPVFNILGGGLCLLIIIWSTYMATQFIDAMLTMTGKRMIIAYPIFLFYMCFLLLAIF